MNYVLGYLNVIGLIAGFLGWRRHIFIRLAQHRCFELRGLRGNARNGLHSPIQAFFQDRCRTHLRRLPDATSIGNLLDQSISRKKDLR
jgi:hypothetical protein